MTYTLTPLINLFECLFKEFRLVHKKFGRPYKYSELLMVIFFITMFIKGIYTFKGMADYALMHYERFRFPSAPSRYTIRRRFYQLPRLLLSFIPFVAENVTEFDERFRFKFGFIDKCLFWAKGGLWHKKQMSQCIVPNKHIDTEASWGKSAYQGWVFGYGLHVIVNRFRFPISASVTTAKIKDYTQIETLLEKLKNALVLLIGDNGYRNLIVIQKIFDKFKTFILVSKPYKSFSKAKREYSFIIKLDYAKVLFKLRRETIEPTFSLVKEFFHLQKKEHLPYKGLKKILCF